MVYKTKNNNSQLKIQQLKRIPRDRKKDLPSI